MLVLDSDAKSVSVFREMDRPEIFKTGDTLVVADILPDFAVPVRALFE